MSTLCQYPPHFQRKVLNPAVLLFEQLAGWFNTDRGDELAHYLGYEIVAGLFTQPHCHLQVCCQQAMAQAGK